VTEVYHIFYLNYKNNSKNLLHPIATIFFNHFSDFFLQKLPLSHRDFLICCLYIIDRLPQINLMIVQTDIVINDVEYGFTNGYKLHGLSR
jgi:hypothetical protein